MGPLVPPRDPGSKAFAWDPGPRLDCRSRRRSGAIGRRPALWLRAENRSWLSAAPDLGHRDATRGIPIRPPDVGRPPHHPVSSPQITRHDLAQLQGRCRDNIMGWRGRGQVGRISPERPVFSGLSGRNFRSLWRRWRSVINAQPKATERAPQTLRVADRTLHERRASCAPLLSFAFPVDCAP